MEPVKEAPKFNDRSDIGDTAQQKKGQKKRRPPGKRNLAIDWDVLEREYLYGIVVETEKGKPSRVYPSLREIAERHAIVTSTVAARSKRYNWLERRREFQRQLEGDFDAEVAKSRALSTAGVATMVDTFISHFGDLVGKKAIKTDTIADLERAVRLKKFIQSELAGATGARNGIDLEELQARHKLSRDRATAFNESEFGKIPGRGERESNELDRAIDAKTNTPDEPETEEAPVEATEESKTNTAPEPEKRSFSVPKEQRPPTAARLGADAVKARRELAAGVADPWRRVELRARIVEAEAGTGIPTRRARSRAA